MKMIVDYLLMILECEWENPTRVFLIYLPAEKRAESLLVDAKNSTGFVSHDRA